MKTKRETCFIVVLLIFANFAYSSVISGIAQPQPGCVFFGYVKIGGQDAPDGLQVTAVLAGTQLNWTTPTVNGTYGWQAKGSSLLVIPSNDLTTGQDGGIAGEFVQFYVNGTIADQNAMFNPSAAQRVDLSIGGSSTTPSEKSILELSLDCSANYMEYEVKITGRLSYSNGTGLSGATLTASYSADEGASWSDIASFGTSATGDYIAGWYPNSSVTSGDGSSSNLTSNYRVRVGWAGNNIVSGAIVWVNLAFDSTEKKYVFSVVSNSTLSNLNYDSSTNALTFSPASASTESGYANVTIPKDLVPSPAQIKVYLDNNLVSYTTSSSNNVLSLHFSYQNTSATVKIDIGSPELSSLNTPIEIAISSGAVVVLIVGLYFGRKRYAKSRKTGKSSSNTLI